VTTQAAQHWAWAEYAAVLLDEETAAFFAARLTEGTGVSDGDESKPPSNKKKRKLQADNAADPEISLRVACLDGSSLDLRVPPRELVREVKRAIGQVRRRLALIEFAGFVTVTLPFTHTIPCTAPLWCWRLQARDMDPGLVELFIDGKEDGLPDASRLEKFGEVQPAIINRAGPLQTFKSLWERDKTVSYVITADPPRVRYPMLSTLLSVTLLISSVDPVLAADHEYCIVGAGPGGIQLAYYLQSNIPARDYVVFERAVQAGSYFEKYPRHRKLISINKRFTGSYDYEFNMRHDWNSLLTRKPEPSLLFREFDKQYFPHADSMVKYLNAYTEHHALNVQYNTTVNSVMRTAYGFSVQTRTGDSSQEATVSCRYVVMATGLAVSNKVNADPHGLITPYSDMSLDVDDYENKTVLVIGRGNAGLETANHIYGSTARVLLAGRSRIKLSWETHYVGNVRGVNNEILDSYMLKSMDGASGYLDASKVDFRRGADGRINVWEMDYDQNGQVDGEFICDDFSPVDIVLDCSGWKMDTKPFVNGLRPEMKTPRYPLLSANFESVNEKGLFIAGTLMHGRDWKLSSGGFVHGFRYLVRALQRQFEVDHHNQKWPSVAITGGESGGLNSLASAINSHVFKRINSMAGPYQMFAYLADLVIFTKDTSGALVTKYLEEVPVDYITNVLDGAEHYFSVIFEYGVGFSVSPYPSPTPILQPRPNCLARNMGLPV
jgi:thioredoxin reductase